VRDLNNSGIGADLLTADQLADSAVLNRAKYAVLVLPYGNTYPKQAFDNLIAFHKAGGCLVTCGIPFTHAATENGDGTWADHGHDGSPALFGPDGIGMGGFGDQVDGPIAPVPTNPFGLGSGGVVWPGSAQALDTAALPAGDTVTAVLASQKGTVAALVAHHGDAFDGAVDAWCNYPHPDDVLIDTYRGEQMLERGAIAVLAAKGLLAANEAKSAFALLAARPSPKSYANVALPAPRRSYSTLQPKMKLPAQHLYVADVRNLPRDSRLLLFSLQGLVNRVQPRIYLISTDTDPFWLDTMQQQGHTGAPVVVADPMSLLTTFHDSYAGAVVADPNVYVSPDVAVDVASTENLLLATPDLAASLGLPIKEDLRGRFKGDVDALHYVRTVLLPKLNPYLGCIIAPKILGSQLDDVIAAKAVCFWVTGDQEQDRPGADAVGETSELEAMLADMPLCAIIPHRERLRVQFLGDERHSAGRCQAEAAASRANA
jgi:hypothetical protein